MKRIACLLLVLALLCGLTPPGTAVAEGEHTPLPEACTFLYEGVVGTIDYTNDRDVAVQLIFDYPDVLISEAGGELAVACGPETSWVLDPGESLQIQLRFGAEDETPAPGRYTGVICWNEASYVFDGGQTALTVIVPEEQETNPVSVTVLGDPQKISWTLWTSKECIDSGSGQSFADQGAVRITGGKAPVGWYVGLEATSRGAARAYASLSFVDDGGNSMGMDGYGDFGENGVFRAAVSSTGQGPVTFTLTVDPVELTLQPNGAPGYEKYRFLPGNWPAAVPENPFTYEGHAFTGWNTRADGSGTPYAPDDEITLTEGFTLYAQWVQDPPGVGHTDFVITAQPQDKTVYIGEKAMFAVVATGAKSYQWYTRANPEKPWTKAKSGTRAILTVTAKVADSGSQFYCEVKNAAGDKLDSDIVTLTVVAPPPAIKTQPKAVKVKSGAKAKLSVKATGKNLTYQWYRWDSEAADWTAIDGATKANYTFAAPYAMNGAQFRCRVKNAAGEAYSNTVTLTVTPQPATIKTQPKNVKVKSREKAKFSVKATGPSLSYQWFSRPPETDEWTLIEGATNAEYSFTAPLTLDGTQFYCRVWNEDGDDESYIALLTVIPQPATIKTQPKDARVRAGAKAKFTVKASGPDLTYQWFCRTSADGEWTAIEGATKASYTVVASASNNGWQFLCRVQNADGEDASTPATLILK